MNRIPGSFRDPAGFVFEQNGKYFRLLTGKGIDQCDRLVQSGLYADLLEKNQILPFREEEINSEMEKILSLANGSFDPQSVRILELEKLDFVSYPCEWPFSLLKDAALLTLKIQKRALKYKMTLKDAVGYNIQFHRGTPVFIDHPSLEEYQEGEPWKPYRQFISHFLGPLLLMSRRDLRFRLDLQNHIEGLPLDYISKNLPISSWFSPSCLLHIHGHAKMVARYADRPMKNEPDYRKGSFSRRNLENLIDSLLNYVESIRPPKIKTEWADYYSNTNYTEGSFREKKRIVSEISARLHPDTTIDLGANRGEFSRAAMNDSRIVLSPDIDPNAAEENYRAVRKNGEKNIYPFLLDLCNPTPGFGWANEERTGILDRLHGDLVLALALIHHLCIGNNVPLVSVAKLFRKMAPALLLEFVPKTDSQTKKLLRAREDIFPDYQLDYCVKVFGKYYRDCQIIPLSESDRTLVFFQDSGY
ncbi:MAG: SAM-dependent methyltransferase [Planctomycetia bacterium]|nr:SAM-dependent methyltransferase [Planctomycetia bacterium]